MLETLTNAYLLLGRALCLESLQFVDKGYR